MPSHAGALWESSVMTEFYLPLKQRRQVSRASRRARQRGRAYTKRMSCHPWRLWPEGTEQHKWWEAHTAGCWDTLLKYYFAAEKLDAIMVRTTPAWSATKAWVMFDT